MICPHCNKSIEPPTLGEIIAMVSARTGVTVAEIMGVRQTRKIADARKETYRELHDRGYSYPEIGRFMGRNNTTVWAGATGGKRRKESQGNPSGGRTLSVLGDFTEPCSIVQSDAERVA